MVLKLINVIKMPQTNQKVALTRYLRIKFHSICTIKIESRRRTFPIDVFFVVPRKVHAFQAVTSCCFGTIWRVGGIPLAPILYKSYMTMLKYILEALSTYLRTF